MRTAIIQTNFWKEDRIFELLPDARYFYLCLLTNPERTTVAAFKCSDRLLVAYTGYNLDTIKLCKKELVSKGFVKIVDGYYIIGEQDFVQPTKGKLSSQLHDKDFLLLPLNVQELLQSRSGATPERKDKDNNKDKDIDISKDKAVTVKVIDKSAIDLAVALGKSINRNLELEGETVKEVTKREIDTWSKDIEMIHRIDGYAWETIYMVLIWSQQDEFWKGHVISGKYLRKKFKQLILKAKSETAKTSKYGAEVI